MAIERGAPSAAPVSPVSPVCVAGMHRSGNAMVAQVLWVCGLWLGPPERLMPAKPDNPDGFFQNTDVVFLNDQLIERHHGGWDAPPPIQRGWERSDLTANLVDDAQAWASLMAEGAGGAEGAAGAAKGASGAVGAWGWADPRTCITLPFWQAVLPDLKVVACLRNPVAVAESLRARGNSSLHFGLQLWQDHNQRLADALPAGQSLVTHYDAWFADAPAELDRVLAFLGWKVPAKVRAAAAACVKPAYRHQMPVAMDWLLRARGPGACALYDRLRAQAGLVYASTPEGQLAPMVPVAEEGNAVAADAMQWLQQELEQQRLKCAELEARLQGLQELPSGGAQGVQLGEAVDFRLGGNSVQYVGAGWSDPEDNGTWSIATVMELSLRLPEKPGASLRLTVRLLPFVAESHPAMPIQLVVNGAELALWHLTAPEMQSVEAVIDANLVGFAGELKIQLVALDARSPQQLGLSEDQRRLGVFVQEICVSLAD
jgi:Sulfotransferase family